MDVIYFCIFLSILVLFLLIAFCNIDDKIDKLISRINYLEKEIEKYKDKEDL